MTDITQQIAKELSISIKQTQSAIDLIDAGNTVPFIARYRKEATGGLDDGTLRDLMDRLTYLRNLQSRKQEVIRLITEQGKMTDELMVKIEAAQGITEVDDLYRPYRPKRRTRATVAKERGLEPLAMLIWQQQMPDAQILVHAAEYIGDDVPDAEAAVAGAKDIVAEKISDDAALRKKLRTLIRDTGDIVSRALTKDSTVYDMYADFCAPVAKMVSHRVLALGRGEKEKVLSVKIDMYEPSALATVLRHILTGSSRPGQYLQDAAEDAYKRLIFPSIERETRGELTEMADEQAIRVFAENLKNLLMQPPVKGKTVLALDPGFRTGNKVAVVDATGRVLSTGVVYMTLEHHDMAKANAYLKKLIKQYSVDVIAIGNGTAGKETEMAVAALLKEIDRKVVYMVVNEAGASVYSASKLGAEEFPDYDVALRSAVSIARRLQDPLAELVKIDPKAIGVGQYQHDVNQKRLAETLEGVVETCVNQVGVDLNTASAPLLRYVAGITPAVAKNIVAMRDETGGFESRTQLKKVPKLGAKAFEQCAGFLRIPDAKNILDNTAIHPESYSAVKNLMAQKGARLSDADALAAVRQDMDTWDVDALAADIGIGSATLNDILAELKKPGRDVRDDFAQPEFRSDVMHLEDLKEGMVLSGTVRNVTDFGAFVDIGVHQDGLVHISQLADRFVKHPMDVVKTGDVVKVKVIGVDVGKKRISLSMKNVQ